MADRIGDEQALFALYMEVLEAFGRVYPDVDKRLMFSVLDGLTNGQYYMARDHDGRIVTFCSYWRIMPGDLQIIAEGGRPENITEGIMVFVVDCFNIVGRNGLSAMIKCLRRDNPGAKGVAWWRYEGEGKPKRFMYFPSQKGGV